jgi:signal transduction histidine kinase
MTQSVGTSGTLERNRPTRPATSGARNQPPEIDHSRDEREGRHRFHKPLILERLDLLLYSHSRIEAHIVGLQWMAMLLVGIGAILPSPLGPGFRPLTVILVEAALLLHPVAYFIVACAGYPRLLRDAPLRMAVLTAIDVTTAVTILGLTVSTPGYTQALPFCVVLLAATRYSRAQAIGITSLLAVLQFFSSLAASRDGIQMTSLSSVVIAMFALTYGVNFLSEAERKEAAIALENARLYRAVLQRNRELATINSLSQTATQDSDPGRLLESGLELILTSLPATWGQAFRYDQSLADVELLFVHCAESRGGSLVEANFRQEALQAAQSRSVVIVGSALPDGEPANRISAPIIVQGGTAGVFQALVPEVESEAGGSPPEQSLAVVCQELGTWIERAMLRDAAQHSLVLEEKSRIARELHDTVLQILFSLGLGVEWCMRRADGDSQLTGRLRDMHKLTASASSELRSAIFTLSSNIAEVGLVPALERLAHDFAKQQSLPVSLSSSGDQPTIPVLCQNAIHRVVRESLMNAYKHAQATHVSVRVIFDPTFTTVVVQDDGVGLSEHVIERYAEDPAHFGLRTVSKQVEQLGGTFEIMNGDESGAIVRATVPIKLTTEVTAYARANAH